MSSIRPARMGLSLVMALAMLLTLIGAGTASASVVGPAAAPAPASALVFGTDSCVGFHACTGAVGPIGDNSCNGEEACAFAVGVIGDNSCNGSDACYVAAGTIEDNSCIGLGACQGAGGSVGDNSCDATAACYVSLGDIGEGSCNALNACNDSDGNVGANSCNGEQACYQAAYSIGNNSCNGSFICDSATNPVGDCMYNVVTPEACLPLDARIKKLHVHNAWIGGGIRNTTAEGQARGRYVAGPTTVRFGIRIQNTGDTADSFSLSISDPDAPECLAFCAAFDADTPGFHVRYRHAHHSITDAVVGGTFVTPVLAPGEWYQFRAKVRVTSGAVPGSRIRRLATFTSVNDGTSQDAVKFVVTALGTAP